MKPTDLVPSLLGLGLAAMGTSAALEGAPPASYVWLFVAGGGIVFASMLRHTRAERQP